VCVRESVCIWICVCMVLYGCASMHLSVVLLH